jgi:hypothetical protein
MTKLLEQIALSIRYITYSSFSYSDENGKSRDFAIPSIKIILVLVHFLVYPQVSRRFTSKQVDIVKSIEIYSEDFLDRFALVAGDVDDPNVKCENPECATSERARKSCGVCGARYCSRLCQARHWELPDAPYKAFVAWILSFEMSKRFITLYQTRTLEKFNF